MSTLELSARLTQLQEWEQIANEAKAEAEAIKDEIKQLMLNRGVEEIEAGEQSPPPIQNKTN